MSYAEALERLKNLPLEDKTKLPELTKGTFVSSGSTRGGILEKNAPQSARLPMPKPAPMDTRVSEPAPVVVRCGQCRHFERDTVNPPEGLGRCGAAVVSERPHYPNAPRYCGTWHPRPTALLEICRAACDGLAVDPQELADWLEAQGDNGWMTPPAARWWAKHISENGYPKD